MYCRSIIAAGHAVRRLLRGTWAAALPEFRHSARSMLATELLLTLLPAVPVWRPFGTTSITVCRNTAVFRKHRPLQPYFTERRTVPCYYWQRQSRPFRATVVTTLHITSSSPGEKGERLFQTKHSVCLKTSRENSTNGIFWLPEGVGVLRGGGDRQRDRARERGRAISGEGETGDTESWREKRQDERARL